MHPSLYKHLPPLYFPHKKILILQKSSPRREAELMYMITKIIVTMKLRDDQFVCDDENINTSKNKSKSKTQHALLASRLHPPSPNYPSHLLHTSSTFPEITTLPPPPPLPPPPLHQRNFISNSFFSFIHFFFFTEITNFSFSNAAKLATTNLILFEF